MSKRCAFLCLASSLPSGPKTRQVLKRRGGAEGSEAVDEPLSEIEPPTTATPEDAAASESALALSDLLKSVVRGRKGDFLCVEREGVVAVGAVPHFGEDDDVGAQGGCFLRKGKKTRKREEREERKSLRLSTKRKLKEKER